LWMLRQYQVYGLYSRAWSAPDSFRANALTVAARDSAMKAKNLLVLRQSFLSGPPSLKGGGSAVRNSKDRWAMRTRTTGEMYSKHDGHHQRY
jgi:hypothetical protein